MEEKKLKQFETEHYYNELTKEEINYQLEMSDQYEFSYHYAKYLEQQLQAYKDREDKLKKVLKNKVEKVKEDIDDLEYADCYIEPWAIEDLKELKKHFDELLQILNKEEK